ncbi:MAG: SGNH/GDSL hydrolase family protein [Clostridia bacterium]|nr:SGNH/GDSL hydrolase family protein [Clostridia bacterium]
MAEAKGFKDRLTGATYDLKDATARAGVATNAAAIAALAETVPAVDDDLNTAGAAADARATGHRLGTLENGILTPSVNSETWERGSLDSASGAEGTSNARLRTPKIVYWPAGLIPDEGYKTEVFVYAANDTYLGILQADGTLAKTVCWFNTSVDLRNVPGDYVRILLAIDVAGSSTEIGVSENVHMKVLGYTDKTLSETGKAADAGATGNKFEEMNSSIGELIDRDSALHNLIYSGTMLEDYCMTSTPASATTPVANSGMNTTDFIAVKGGETIVCHNFRRYWWYKSDKSAVSDTSTGNLSDRDVFDTITGAKLLKAPQSAAYIRVCYRAVASDQSEADTDVYLYRPTGYDQFLYSCIYQGIGKKYIALGSSLVAGTYSEIGNPQSVGIDPNVSFVRWIAEYNGYVITNLGAGGQGWINPSNASNQSVCDVIDENYQPNADPPVNNFSDAEIITLTLGTNDYKAQWKAADSNPHEWTLGSVTDTPAKNSTVMAAMRYALEKLIAAAPQAQIIVTIPGNFKKLGVATSGVDYGDEIDVVDGRLYAKETNNWALGTHNHENKTLADYKAAIKECADYCGVRTVDVGSICAANRYNMDSMLGDGIHPTEEYYKMMGYALAPFIK